MPKLTKSTPKYRRHRASGQAVVTLSGKDIYLGPFGSRTSVAKHDRVVAEWLSRGRQLPTSASDRLLTVIELLVAYKRHCRQYYRGPDGGTGSEVRNIHLALRPVRQLYARTPATEFGPRALKTVREKLLDNKLSRREINKRVGRIVRVFKWGVENELIPPSIYQALKTVPGLRYGRSGAHETEPIRPVSDAQVQALEPHVLPPIWAMIQLQRLTGMRPGEVVVMRGQDLDRSGKVWIYSPERHKTAHHGHRRNVPLGPLAQAILQPWLTDDPSAYLFSPRQAVEVLNQERKKRRKSPMTPSQAARQCKRSPRKAPGEFYTRNAYTRAIATACKKAGVAHWHPNQLRHTVGTELRRRYGLDVARVVLGHRSPVVTEIYAQLDLARAIEAMAATG